MIEVSNDITAAEAAKLSAEKSDKAVAKELERIFNEIRSATSRGDMAVSVSWNRGDFLLERQVGSELNSRGFKYEFGDGGTQWDPAPPFLRVWWEA